MVLHTEQALQRLMQKQVDLLLQGILLKEQIDRALRERDEALFKETVPLYKEICQACFWRL